MDCVDIEEIFKLLDKNVNDTKSVLKNKIRSKFHLSRKETDLIYSEWKAEYVKAKTY